MKIRGLSFTQPWVQLVALGEKSFDTRSWATSYRGRIAIHASEGFPERAARSIYQRRINEALDGYGTTKLLPLGAIIATCDLVTCTLTEQVRNEIPNREKDFQEVALPFSIETLPQVAGDSPQCCSNK